MLMMMKMLMMMIMMMMIMLMISSARMIATLEVVHRGKLSHPAVGHVTTALCQSRQLHAIACCLLGRLQLGEIEPLALTQALVAALAGVSGASVPSPLAQGPSGAHLGRGISAQIQTHSSGVPEEAAKPRCFAGNAKSEA